ncbi:hypothetical protein BJY52DRAFT_1418838 [Lactarius psammicola]|nr:hypothetical protein BJY52DRAFT_1418838 [Lactarius psammicola]
MSFRRRGHYDESYSRSPHFPTALFKRVADKLWPVWERRRKFYKEIVDDVQARADTVPKDLGDALEMFLRCLNDDTQIGRISNNLPGVFIAFDEARSLAAEPLDQSTNWTHITELHRALRVFRSSRCRETHRLYSIEKTPDYLFLSATLVLVTAIDDITSMEMRRAYGPPVVGYNIIPRIAVQKLLCGPDDGFGQLSLTTDQEFAVLSQRLALAINSTT